MTPSQDERLRQRLEALTDAVPLERQHVARAGAPMRPVRPTVRTMALPGALGTLALLVIVVAGAAWLAGRTPSGTSGPAVIGVSKDGDFELTIRADRAAYQVGDPITASASLTYRGALASVTIAGAQSSVLFGVQQLDGALAIEPVVRQSCVVITLLQGQPLNVPYAKSVAYVPEDPAASFKAAYFTGPLLRLPIGIWRIYAAASFSEGLCERPSHQFQASVMVTVGPQKAAASNDGRSPTPAMTQQATVAPSISATPPGSASYTVDTVAFWDDKRGLAGATSTASDGSGSGQVLVTTDGGRIWSVALQIPAGVGEVWVAGTAAWALAGCPADPSCGRLYHSTDGGVTWTYGSTDLVWIAFSSPTIGWGIASTGGSNFSPAETILRETRDGGTTWRDVPSPCATSPTGGLRAIAFGSTSSGLAVCALTLGAGGEFHSTLATADGGAHWIVRASTGIPGTSPNPGATADAGTTAIGTIPYGGYIKSIVVAADGTAWIVGDRMVPLASRDGGATWLPLGIGVPDVNEVRTAWPLDAQHGFSVMSAPDRQATLLEATTDGGRSWTERSVLPSAAP